MACRPWKVEPVRRESLMDKLGALLDRFCSTRISE
jgi:hypothetical protein